MLKEVICNRAAGDKVRCLNCLFSCSLSPGDKGKCGVVVNIGGTLYESFYGVLPLVRVVSTTFLHAFKGRSLVVGGMGCNLSCFYCRWGNKEERFSSGKARVYTAQDVVSHAISSQCSILFVGCGEPLCNLRFLYDLFVAAKRAGLKTVVHTAGTFSSCSMSLLKECCDLALVDVKACSKEVFRRITGSFAVRKILESVELFFREGMAVEVVTPVITGYNDSVFEIRSIARWIASNLSPDTVWHIVPCNTSSGFERYPSPSVEKLVSIASVGMEEGLRRVIIHQEGGFLYG